MAQLNLNTFGCSSLRSEYVRESPCRDSRHAKVRYSGVYQKENGDRNTGYILNIENGDVAKLISNDYTLASTQETILTEFVELVRNKVVQHKDSADPYVAIYYELQNVCLPDGRHVFNCWNEQVGGSSPEIDESDSVSYSISLLAFEQYPFLLLPHPMSSHIRFHCGNIMLNWHKVPMVCDKIVNDEVLNNLFSERGNNIFDTQGYFVTSCGCGGSVQLCMLAENVIHAAVMLCRMKNNYSKITLHNNIINIVNVYRDAVRGKKTRIPFVMLFNNCILQENLTFNIEDCNIISYNAALERYVPHEARPNRISVGGNTCINGFMVTGSCEYEVKIGKEELESDHAYDAWQSLDKELTSISEKIRLSFALAIGRDRPLGITLGCILLFDPFKPTGSILWNPQTRYRGNEHICSEEELENIGCWYRRLCEVDTSSIDVGIRRINLATSSDRNPIDSFVDAVIALENIFGVSTEARFRVSASVAKLLDNDVDTRQATQKQVSKFYDQRSAILHGRSLPQKEIATLREDCIQVVLRVFRKLFEHRQELIGDADRSKTLLLEQ